MDDPTWFFAVLIAGVITGLIGLWVAKQKGRSEGEGFLLGFLLSAIGLVIEGLLPETPKPVRRTSKADSRVLALGNPKPSSEPHILSADGRPLEKCPFCAEMILAEAIVCRYCQRELPACSYFAHSLGSIYHRRGCPKIPPDAQEYSSLANLPAEYDPCRFCNPPKR